VSPRQSQVRELLVHLDRSGQAPISRQLEEQLREAIQDGRLESGQTLPSTRMLAEDLAVSRGVVVRAYTQLAAEGYVTMRQGTNPSVGAIGTPLAETALREQADPSPRLRYDLRPERPDLSQFPRGDWLRSVRHALNRATDAELGYADCRGLHVLRQELARYLARARGLAITADRIVITVGSTHALTLIEHVLHRRGERTIGLENPSHELMHRLARRCGLEPVGIAVDEEGLRVDALVASRVTAVVVSPAHQFPTGVAYTAERRAELARWAEETGGLILEDDYDAEFRYDRSPIGALQGLAPERVAYIGSTSKTLIPGLRLGWVVLPSALIDDVATELGESMLHHSALEQLAFADFLRRGELDRHLRRMRLLYRRRRDSLVTALARAAPQFPVSGTAAGLHLLLELPSAGDEASACAHASKHGIAVQCVGDHTLPGYGGVRGLLIGYGTLQEAAVDLAVRELASALAVTPSMARNDSAGSAAAGLLARVA
jgi:GntR family transcriptional regulator / MocR family aminotransferase